MKGTVRLAVVSVLCLLLFGTCTFFLRNLIFGDVKATYEEAEPNYSEYKDQSKQHTKRLSRTTANIRTSGSHMRLSLVSDATQRARNPTTSFLPVMSITTWSGWWTDLSCRSQFQRKPTGNILMR